MKALFKLIVGPNFFRGARVRVNVINIDILIIAIIIAALMFVLMNKTRFGKNCYAIGGNINAARINHYLCGGC
ncbi:MAG TPA: hypothetical protein DDW65_20715 [Firmicutes bacterium]|nr:hypothetical protein [Bacillota bacterium]